MNTKLLVLDCDGVLNSSLSSVATGELFCEQFSPLAVLLVLRLAILADADILLSSSWRLDRNYPAGFNKAMYDAGWPSDRAIPLLGRTPYIERNRGVIRGEEVQEWMAANRPGAIAWEDYIILDDTADFYPWQPLMQTNPEHGLSHTEYARICKLWGVSDKANDALVFRLRTTFERKSSKHTGTTLW